MIVEDLAKRVADHQAIDWESNDTSDPIVAGLKKIYDYHQAIARNSDTKYAANQHSPGAWANLNLIEQIGQGTYGEVYRAFDPVLQRDVALKVVRNPDTSLLDSDDFIAEAQRLAQVRHRHVMAVMARHITARKWVFGANC